MIPTIIQATTIPDAWFQLVYKLMRGDAPHSVYEINKGSYVGQKRLEYDFIMATISHPGAEPRIPDIPPGLGIPAPVESMEYVEDYFTQYLMNPEIEDNETYKYATWTAPGVERVIEQLRGAPGNNQAAISVGGWAPDAEFASVVGPKTTEEGYAPRQGDGLFIDTDNYIDPGTGQRDPACLRVLDFRFDQQKKLHVFIYFRSWDLWGGFPANLAGIQRLKEYVAENIGAEDGSMICASKGLHLYDHCIDVAAKRIGMSDVGTMDDFLNWVEKKDE